MVIFEENSVISKLSKIEMSYHGQWSSMSEQWPVTVTEIMDVGGGGPLQNQVFL